MIIGFVQMKLSRVFVSGLLVVGALLGASTSVKSDVYCNSYGRTTGSIGNDSVNCYTNSYGRTSC